MDLQQIKYFLAVVDFGTFLAASEQVHVSQPTLSAGIRKLEDSLKVKLFERGSRAATLTEAGELFLASARQSYNQLMTVKSKLSSEQDKIHIGVLNTLPMDHVAQIIRTYRNQYPYVFIELVVDNHESISQMLQLHKLDLVFTTSHDGSGKFVDLFEEHLKVAISVQHPLAAMHEIVPEQLAGQPFIERIRCESWDAVHGVFEDHNIQLKTVCRAENDESVLALVAANLGVSIMPVRNTPYDVRFIRIKGLQLTRSIGLGVSTQPLSSHAQVLFDTAIEIYKNE